MWVTDGWDSAGGAISNSGGGGRKGSESSVNKWKSVGGGSTKKSEVCCRHLFIVQTGKRELEKEKRPQEFNDLMQLGGITDGKNTGGE